MMANSGLEQKSVIKFLAAEKCKPCEIYKRMCDGEACFSPKMFTYGLVTTDSVVKKKFQVQQSIYRVMLTVFSGMKGLITIDFLKDSASYR